MTSDSNIEEVEFSYTDEIILVLEKVIEELKEHKELTGKDLCQRCIVCLGELGIDYGYNVKYAVNKSFNYPDSISLLEVTKNIIIGKMGF